MMCKVCSEPFKLNSLHLFWHIGSLKFQKFVISGFRVTSFIVCAIQMVDWQRKEPLRKKDFILWRVSKHNSRNDQCYPFDWFNEAFFL